LRTSVTQTHAQAHRKGKAAAVRGHRETLVTCSRQRLYYWPKASIACALVRHRHMHRTHAEGHDSSSHEGVTPCLQHRSMWPTASSCNGCQQAGRRGWQHMHHAEHKPARPTMLLLPQGLWLAAPVSKLAAHAATKKKVVYSVLAVTACMPVWPGKRDLQMTCKRGPIWVDS
jgi:hypothetical protein